jgi:uncharacterized protein (TIGR03086 family)
MNASQATAERADGVALLERAIGYTLGSLLLVTPEAMSRRTPCAEWDLRALLRHMNDSLAALHEAVDVGHVGLEVSLEYGDPDVNPVATLRKRACTLLGSWTSTDTHDVITIGDCPTTTSIVTSTGALEVAVHGWDVARACGHDRPIPPTLAQELLRFVPMLVTDADRPGRFGTEVDVPFSSAPGDRLLALLGRDPR